MAAEFPNTEPLEVGAYVVNVHPCATYSDTGVVLFGDGASEGGGWVTVQYGIGGTCYGPAANWTPTDRRPEWLARLEARA